VYREKLKENRKGQRGREVEWKARCREEVRFVGEKLDLALA
jgi:hypothetical protein